MRSGRIWSGGSVEPDDAGGGGGEVKLADIPGGASDAFGRSDDLGPAAGYAVVGIVFALIAGIYFGSVRELFGTWVESPSYNHCLLVLPVTAWFLWRLRGSLYAAPMRPWPIAVGLVLLSSAIWLAGTLADLKSLRDLAIVLFVPAVLSALLGKRFVHAALFPLVFTLFAWPFGEIFVPTMMDWTADFTVAALRATGVPVFREGNNFIIPSGEWSVVEECSGIRYLMASLSAGAFYAYVNFRSNVRRSLFIVLALVVPIVANWLRAYFTVLLGHLSDNTIAVGFDHLVYGWVFFGVVMFGLFMIGARMIDEPPPLPAVADGALLRFSRSLVPAAIGVILVASIGPAWYAWANAREPHSFAGGVGDPTMPEVLGDWRRERPDAMEQGPVLPTGLVTVVARYGGPRGQVGMHVAAGWGSRADNTVFSYSRTARFGGNRRWSVVNERIPSRNEPGGARVVERLVTDGTRRLVVWQWYRVGPTNTADFARAKVAVAMSRLAGAEDPGVVVTLYAEYSDDAGSARETLEAFRGAIAPVVESWIQR